MKSNQSNVEALIEVLTGLSDLGAKREAERVIRQLLNHPAATARALWMAVSAIGSVSNRPRKWRNAIESVYTRLPKREREAAGNTMLAYYHLINDTGAALPFCKLTVLESPTDVMFAMDVFLDQGKLDWAQRLARRAEMILTGDLSAFDASCLIDAVASFYARVRNWQRARELWSIAPRDQPVSKQAAVGTVETLLAQTLEAAQRELAIVAKLKKRPEPDKVLQLSVPGVEGRLLSDTEKALRRITRGLERLLLPQRRKDLGLFGALDSA